VNKLRSENIALRDQLQRSLKELKLFQAKYPSPYASQIGLSGQDEDDAPKLSASPEITSALFEAYDTRKFKYRHNWNLWINVLTINCIAIIVGIYELEDTIKHLNTKLATFRENVSFFEIGFTSNTSAFLHFYFFAPFRLKSL